ncbi:uncharacterized protein LOC115034308 [Acyrthosiphon pisum]|uniref:Uncharacterized protein n=1 Tax=Acyrthosiphon pisum TaxID=7029 RepID=A0A8R2JTT4_ACYPI|nr:uncharacterized protein LOC115034308 [Acyrthosiphon pisum]
MRSSTFYLTLLFGIAILISCGYGTFTTEQIDYYGRACKASEGNKRFLGDIVIFG